MDKSEWSGLVGDAWAQEWRRTDRTFEPVDRALVDAVVSHFEGAVPPRLLEVGCGAGTTALHLAARLPEARIVGIDLSPALVATATARAAEEPHCRFIEADASVWQAEGGFDALVSRHGVMFFDDPVAAFAHLRTLAKPGAPLFFTCFRAPRANTWASGIAHLLPGGGGGDPHAPGPFAFADPERVSGLLAAAGWRGAVAVPVDYAYVAGEGADPVADALAFFQRIGPSARAVRELDGAERERFVDGLVKLVRDHHVEDRVLFPAAAWLWTARA